MLRDFQMSDGGNTNDQGAEDGTEDAPRPGATLPEALSAMDRLIATSMIAQQEMAQRLGLNVSDLTCFGYVLEAA